MHLGASRAPTVRLGRQLAGITVEHRHPALRPAAVTRLDIPHIVAVVGLILVNHKGLNGYSVFEPGIR
jgi:hypothetical protein